CPVSYFHCFNLNGSIYQPEGGAMTDLQETIDTIIKASDFPSSILVAGVGGADGNGDNGTGKLLAII
ncbi:Os08g0133200, partial [Oryza sativa Japonica Group]